MNLQDITQRLIGDASSYVKMYEQAIKSHQEFERSYEKTQATVRSGMGFSGQSLPGMDANGFAEFSRRMALANREVEEFGKAFFKAGQPGLTVLNKAGNANVLATELQFRKARQIFSGMQMKEEAEGYVRSMNPFTVPEFGAKDAQVKYMRTVEGVRKQVEDSIKAKKINPTQAFFDFGGEHGAFGSAKEEKKYIRSVQDTRRKLEEALKARKINPAQALIDFQGEVPGLDEKARKQGMGFGRWWLAGAAMHIGSQLGPVGGILGDVAGGALIGGGPGAGFGLLVGATQQVINGFKFVEEVGRQTLTVVGGFAESAAHHFVNLSLESVKIGAEFDRLRTTLGVVSQSASFGDQLFSGIQHLSLLMPYTVIQLGQAAEEMLAMGVAANDILPAMRELGTIAGGDELRLRNLSLAFAEIQAEGVISFRRIRQLASAGIGIGDIARAYGKTLPETTAALHANKVGAEVLSAAVNQLNSATGRFGSLNETILSRTFGQWRLLENQILLVKGAIGEALAARLDLPGRIEAVVEWLSAHAEAIQDAFVEVWVRIAAGAEVLWREVKVGFQGVLDYFGLGGKTFQEMLPSVERVQQFMRDMVHSGMVLAVGLAEAVRLFIKLQYFAMEMAVSMAVAFDKIDPTHTFRPFIQAWDEAKKELMKLGAFDFADTLVESVRAAQKQIEGGGEAFDLGASLGRGVARGAKAEFREDVQADVRSVIKRQAEIQRLRSEVMRTTAWRSYNRDTQIADLDRQFKANAATLEKLLGIPKVYGGALLGEGKSGPLGAYGEGKSGPANLFGEGRGGEFPYDPLELVHKAAIDQINEKRKGLGTEAQAFLNSVQEAQSRGTDMPALEQFNRERDLVSEILNYREPVKNDWVRFFVPNATKGISEEAQKGVFLRSLKNFQGLERLFPGPEERLPAPALAGSQAAADSINRGMYQQTSIQERIEAFLARATVASEETRKEVGEIADFFKHNLHKD